MFFLCKMDSSIWWETNRSVRRQLPVRWILSSSTGRHFVVLDSEYPCLFRVAWNRNTSTSNHHQSMLLSASRFKFLLLAIVCELQILAHVLLHHLGPSCAAFVLRRKIWTCRRVEEDQWSGYRFQTNFQLLVLGSWVHLTTHWSHLKAIFVAIFFSAQISTCTSCSCQVGNDLHMSLMSIYASEHKKVIKTEMRSVRSQMRSCTTLPLWLQQSSNVGLRDPLPRSAKD